MSAFHALTNRPVTFPTAKFQARFVSGERSVLRGGTLPRMKQSSLLSRTTAILMTAQENDDGTANTKDQHGNSIMSSLTLPSLSQVLYAWLILVSGSRLAASVPYLATNTANTWNLALNGVLCAGSLVLLAKTFQKIDYDALEDLSQKSLARQAGAWALEGVVPTTFEIRNNNTDDDQTTTEATVCQVATFSGGCFWGTELHYQRIPGVIATAVGYTQGRIAQPTYEQVCSGTTEHTEAVQLLFDPTVCSYERLLDKLFETIDPTLLNRVGNDRGTQYRHGVYFHTDAQAEAAERVLEQVRERYAGKPVVTELLPAQVFWPAENYHQRYLEKGGQSAARNCDERVRCYG